MDPVKEPVKEEPKEVVAGSIVRLKSGGPTMTVQGMIASGQADCAWFTEADPLGEHVQRHTFLKESLEVVDAKEGNQGKKKPLI